jgi:hypothetical protein
MFSFDIQSVVQKGVVFYVTNMLISYVIFYAIYHAIYVQATY